MTDTIDTTASKKRNRSFKVKLSAESELYGRYNGDSPYQAANKALSEIIRSKVKNNESVFDEINFYLVESTKGSLKKVHQYLGKRIQLENPVIYKVGEQEIVKNFKNILKKVKKVNDNESSNEPTKKVSTKKSDASGKKAPVNSKKNTTKKVAAAKATTKKVTTKKVTTKKLEDKEKE
jgi:hypothetical protein